MKNTDNLNEMLELRNLGYGPTVIATHFKMHKGTVSVTKAKIKQIND